MKIITSKKTALALFAICYLLVAVSPVLAQEGLPNPLCTEAQTAANQCTIPYIIGKVIQAVLGVVGSIALLMFIYGGFTWLTAAGNEKNVEKGKNILTWAVIGLAIIFSSYVLVNFVIGGLTSGGGT